MKQFNTQNRPLNSVTKYKISLSKSALKNGWTNENAEMFYMVDDFDRTIKLCMLTSHDYGEYNVIRWNQYAEHRGGSFTVTHEQQRKFDNQLKRVKKQAI